MQSSWNMLNKEVNFMTIVSTITGHRTTVCAGKAKNLLLLLPLSTRKSGQSSKFNVNQSSLLLDKRQLLR
jgi:hypothetical protein